MTVTTEYRVQGMTCSHCVTAVTEELSALDGVTGVDVTLAPQGASTVRVTSAVPPTGSDIAEAVAEAGYELVD